MGLLQRRGAALDEADPLHHDEVRLLRAHHGSLYKYVVPKPQSQCTEAEQLAVTFVAGYIAGIFCAVVSQPADSVVSVLNKEKGSAIFEVLRKLGFGGVWKGLFSRIIMIGTLTALQWFIYDSVKVYFKLPCPPVAQAPESLKKQK